MKLTPFTIVYNFIRNGEGRVDLDLFGDSFAAAGIYEDFKNK